MLNIKRTEVIPEKPEGEVVMTKLAIGVEGGASGGPEFTYETTLKCFACDPVNGSVLPSNAEVDTMIEAIMAVKTPSQVDAVAWEDDEKTPCPHTLDPVPQVEGVTLKNATLAKCQSCDLTENLWLCLTCGELGCGRKQWGPNAPPGNNHAITHFEATGHQVAVKKAH